MRRALLLLPVAMALCSPGHGVSAASSELHGYVAMADGTPLKYTVNLPGSGGRFPVALIYDAYCEGDGPLTCSDPVAAAALLAHGYAVLGVNVRGTGCSGGTFNILDNSEWRDGAAVVEWAAAQPWSDGQVGMFGLSYPGITQLGVASELPAHLRAIAPWQVVSDTYRDVAYPGGVFNSGFASLWSLGLQPKQSYHSALTAVEQQDPVCTRDVAQHAMTEPASNSFLRIERHPYDDEFWAGKAPGAGAASISVPVLGCVAWQDDEASSRQGDSFYEHLDPTRTWIVATNGYHGICDDPPSGEFVDLLIRYFDRFVKGVTNGYEQTPHVQLWHETQNLNSRYAPRWITTFASWADVSVKPLDLYFRGGGTLSAVAPASAEAADSYRYPMPAPSTEDGGIAGQHNALWKVPVPAGGSVAYTTPALARDAEFFGPASADIWLASTRTDTDLQLTLTEVRPDGQELYVQRGWLRASHRLLDPGRSTALLPYQTEQESDAQPLTPGKPTYVRVELFPLDHVFRAGSSIRMVMDAPAGETGGWSFDFLKMPGTNTILHDAAHRSRLVLGYLPTGTAHGIPLPACDTLLNQPCRANATSVPGGTLVISGNDGVANTARPSAELSADQLPLTSTAAGFRTVTALGLASMLVIAALGTRFRCANDRGRAIEAPHCSAVPEGARDERR